MSLSFLCLDPLAAEKEIHGATRLDLVTHRVVEGVSGPGHLLWLPAQWGEAGHRKVAAGQGSSVAPFDRQWRTLPSLLRERDVWQHFEGEGTLVQRHLPEARDAPEPRTPQPVAS